jgi:MFS family permease
MGWKQFPPLVDLSTCRLFEVADSMHNRHIYCAAVVAFWGFVASIQAAAFNWSGMMACRFFLGVAEAAFGPGVPLYLTYFYPREMVGFRHGVFISGKRPR